MNIHEMVVERVKTLEHLLEENYGATGRGLGEKTRSVKKFLPVLVAWSLREVAIVRNKFIHGRASSPDSVPSEFEAVCEELERQLSNPMRQTKYTANTTEKNIDQIHCSACADIANSVSHGYCSSCQRFFTISETMAYTTKKHSEKKGRTTAGDRW